MIPSIIGGVISVVRALSQTTEGQQNGITDQIANTLEDYLTRDERVKAQLNEFVEGARQHDIATQVKGYWVVDVIRGLVRPIITFTAMGLLAHAKVTGAPLSTEEYAIIGGIFAFWFGFRPFEKRLRR